MSQQLFDDDDIHTIFEQVSGITVAKRMQVDLFFNDRFFNASRITQISPFTL